MASLKSKNTPPSALSSVNRQRQHHRCHYCFKWFHCRLAVIIGFQLKNSEIALNVSVWFLISVANRVVVVVVWNSQETFQGRHTFQLSSPRGCWGVAPRGDSKNQENPELLSTSLIQPICNKQLTLICFYLSLQLQLQREWLLQSQSPPHTHLHTHSSCRNRQSVGRSVSGIIQSFHCNRFPLPSPGWFSFFCCWLLCKYLHT